MKGRFEDRMNEREAYEIRSRVQDFEDPYRLMTKNSAFDFYGKLIRVSQTEEDKFIQNIFIKDAHQKLEEAEGNIEMMISEVQ